MFTITMFRISKVNFDDWWRIKYKIMGFWNREIQRWTDDLVVVGVK